jgi:Transposase domain (DUF772)
MRLPEFSTQGELFSTAGLSASRFAPTDRYRLFAKVIYPRRVAARHPLEECDCAQNGRVALEAVLMLGVSLLQFLDGVPDRQAVEMLPYQAGWNFALNRQLGDPRFHPTSLGHFRDRLEEHQPSALGFTTILDGLEAAGLVSRQSRQRLDSTPMFGRLARMSRLDCVRESLRLALNELAEALPAEARPRFGVGLWEHYVESQVDYRASGPKVQLLRRVFAEQFDVRAGAATPLPKEQVLVSAAAEPTASEAVAATAASTSVPPETPPASPASSRPMSPAQAEAGLPKGPGTEPASVPAQASCGSPQSLATGGQSADHATQDQPASSGGAVQLTRDRDPSGL